ncbi:MAG: glucose-6-phosphate dehydrogenase (NADP(+)), partial [Patescibacteria group bacterium]|nr:glucose-6-phosphate dehydrogenase (NADP(+)) [Patescibacteria group bacterium]
MKDPLVFVIFGITSNLAQIKLIPAFYDMEEKGILPAEMKIIGNARTPMSEEEFCNYLAKVLNTQNIHHQHPIKQDILKRLLERFNYLPGHLDDPGLYGDLKKEISSFSKKIFYLATYPDLYHHIFENLHKVGLEKGNGGFTRIMIEKPIGSDLSSAKKLNQLLLKYFSEEQIYRLDHYLGKETLQNILTFRFANDIFEPLINASNIDHIQITASENFGIGKRGGYYDQVGALKDVGQNHQLQMLAFATMQAPKEFTSKAVTAERIKILKSLVPMPEKIVFGQYEGYTKEEHVDQNSETETFYALKTYLNSERFKDMPIYIRAGKKMAQTATEISIIFKNPVNKMFRNTGDEPNVLI